MIMVITRAAKPYVIGKYGLNPGINRLAAGPTPRTPSLAWASPNMTMREPTIRNMANAVIAGIRYVLNLAYNCEIRHLATLSKNSDRKSTRLNSSHANISYAVFCLKKKKKKHILT